MTTSSTGIDLLPTYHLGGIDESQLRECQVMNIMGQTRTVHITTESDALADELGGIDESQLRECQVMNIVGQTSSVHITTESDALADELESMMDSTNLTMSPQQCIFKVPNILKRHNPKAYAPNAFSIGPYHYGKKHLKATRKIKLMYLHDLVSSFSDPKTMLRILTGAVSEAQQEARDCYAEPIDHISKDELVKILVLDGCFLIELFLKNAYMSRPKVDDPIFTMSCMSELLGHDLILLENQIPWLVLELLFDITRKPKDRPIQLSRLVLHYCNHTGIIFSSINDVTQPFLSKEHENKHILDMLRSSLVLSSSITHERSFEWQPMPSATKLKKARIKFKTGLKSLFQNLIICFKKCLPDCAHREDKSIEWKCMPSATRLKEAGIKFKKGTSSKSILDIKFEDGVLEMPPLDIHEDTESLFRNIIYLEQCLPNCAPIVTCYAILLDSLINTTEDMEILCKRGIIDNWLKFDDATEFFNQLYNDTFVKEFYYTQLVAQVNEYCGRLWPRYRAWLMHDYVRPYLTAHPWAFVSVTAATILLVLTFLQTLFTIIN